MVSAALNAAKLKAREALDAEIAQWCSQQAGGCACRARAFTQGHLGSSRESCSMAELKYTVILEPDEDAFRVIVPALPEIATFGVSVEDALAMAREAIELALAVRKDEGEEIPPSDSSATRVEAVAITLPAA
ncbi:MAG: type II toxin-antitoxin system HicB family antitoxin [Bacillati bacterium]